MPATLNVIYLLHHGSLLLPYRLIAWLCVQEKLYLDGPLSDKLSLERPDNQRSNYLGRKPLRKEQLSNLPAVLKAC